MLRLFQTDSHHLPLERTLDEHLFHVSHHIVLHIHSNRHLCQCRWGKWLKTPAGTAQWPDAKKSLMGIHSPKKKLLAFQLEFKKKWGVTFLVSVVNFYKNETLSIPVLNLVISKFANEKGENLICKWKGEKFLFWMSVCDTLTYGKCLDTATLPWSLIGSSHLGSLSYWRLLARGS